MDITLILGASTKKWRYSHSAAVMLMKHKHRVILLGKDEGMINDVPIIRKWPEGASIHTITMYLNRSNQIAYYDAILNSGARRLIFNPGSENTELARKAEQKGIEVIEACTLVMLSTGAY